MGIGLYSGDATKAQRCSVKNAHTELLSPEPTVKYRGWVGECGRDEQLRAMAVLLGLGFES